MFLCEHAQHEVYPLISVGTSRGIRMNGSLTDGSTVWFLELATAFIGSQPFRLPCMGPYKQHGIWTQGGQKWWTILVNFSYRKCEFCEFLFLFNNAPRFTSVDSRSHSNREHGVSLCRTNTTHICRLTSFFIRSNQHLTGYHVSLCKSKRNHCYFILGRYLARISNERSLLSPLFVMKVPEYYLKIDHDHPYPNHHP
jgi:hypothetical protein